MSLPICSPLTTATFRALVGARPSPCLSIYLPTRRIGPGAEADQAAFGRVLDQLELSLHASRGRAETGHLLRPWRALGRDGDFWRTTGDGFAGFASLDQATIVPLDGRVEPMAVVGRRFHTLPIVQRLISTEHCRAVAITSRTARVYAGRVSDDGEERLDPLPMEGADDGGFSAGVVPGADRSHPLVVIGLPRLAACFVKNLPRRTGPVELIAIDPQRLSDAEIAHMVGDRMRVTRQRRQTELGTRFLEARTQGRVSGDFTDIARAAAAGRVEVLVVEAGRREAGTIDRRDGTIEFPAASGANVEPTRSEPEGDLYGALAGIVLEHAGAVWSLPAKAMPTRTGVGAIHRWEE